jgi:membrane protein implicated in regulation of membrane protease activity
MEAFSVFAIIGVVLFILEVAVPGFVLLPIGVGFLLTAIVAYFVPSLLLQLLSLSIFAPLCLLFFKRLFKKESKSSLPSNFEGLAGQEGITEEDIPPNSRGYVKVYGDSWKVEGLSEPLPKGTKVIVERVAGTKIYIRKA